MCICIISFFSERERCSVSCNGTYTIKEPDPHRKCVGFNIKFKLEETLITYIKVFPCEILNCSLEVVDFDCTFNRSHTEFTDGEKRSCIGNFLCFAFYDTRHEIVIL